MTVSGNHSSNENNLREHSQDRGAVRAAAKMAYSKPSLRFYGEIRDLTLGGTGGTTESGQGGGSIYAFQNPGFNPAFGPEGLR